MIYAPVVALALGANQAEISTSDLRKNAAFDNLKATWGKVRPAPRAPSRSCSAPPHLTRRPPVLLRP